MKIVITGIAGFLGRNLIASNSTNEIVGIDINEGIVDGIKVISSQNLDTLNFDAEVVILCHAAVVSGNTQIENKILFHANVELTEIICKKFKNAFFIYISTAAVYDLSVNKIAENAPIYPQSDYAISKLWGEKIVLKYNAVILRLSSLYGVGMKENTLIPNYVNQALQKNKIEVWGKGERMQNYVHVQDIANYINTIINKKQVLRNNIFLGVASKEYTNIEIAKLIAEQTNTKIAFVNEDNSKSVTYNNTKTLETLLFKPKMDIQTGIFNYIQWKKEQF